MRWRRRLIVLFTIGLLGLYPLLAPPPHRIDQAHCDLIKEGMTKDEVESIFGVPPGEYDFAEQKFSGYRFRVWVRATGKSTLLDLTSVAPSSITVLESSPILPHEWSTWTGREGAFTVCFDVRGRVTSTSGPHEVTLVPPWQRWWKKLTD